MHENKYIKAVHARCPDEKVIAGPYLVNHVLPELRQEERTLASKALRLQTQNGEVARLVMLGPRAFVLKPRTDCMKAGKDGKPTFYRVKRKTKGDIEP